MEMTAELNDELDAKLLLKILSALKKGDFSTRMPADWSGVAGKIADTVNDIIEMNQQMVESITDVSRVVGQEGRLSHRAQAPSAVGGWAVTINAVKTQNNNKKQPTTEKTHVSGAGAKGDLAQTMALDVD